MESSLNLIFFGTSHWYVFPDWWLAGFAFLTLIVVIVQTSAAARAAKAASDAASAAKLSVDAADRQITIMEAQTRALIGSERAWILETIHFPNDLPVQPDAGNAIIAVVGFSFRNRGRTPARILAIKLRFHALEAPNTLPDSPQYDSGYIPQLGAYGMVMAADDEPLSVGRPYEGSGGTFQKGDRRAVIENKLSIYAYGVIEYETMDSQRSTQFCYVWHEPRGIMTSADTVGFRKGGPREYNKAT